LTGKKILCKQHQLFVNKHSTWILKRDNLSDFNMIV